MKQRCPKWWRTIEGEQDRVDEGICRDDYGDNVLFCGLFLIRFHAHNSIKPDNQALIEGEERILDRPKVTSLPPDLADVTRYEQRSAPRYADEIRLVHIWLVLSRGKFTIAALILVSIAIGSAYALFTPHSYAYTTIIEVGTNGRNELIEPLETSRTKVVEGYIPQVLQEHIKRNPDDKTQYGIRVEIPRNSQVLVLRSQGTAEQEQMYATLHNAVADRLKSDHLRIQSVLQRGLGTQLEMRERSLTELREQAKAFETQINRLEGKRELPARELAYLTSLRLADNQRAQSELVPLVDVVRLQLNSMRETSAVVSPMRSLDPTDIGKGTVVTLAALAGLFLGIIAAFFVEFVAIAREDASPRSQAQNNEMKTGSAL